MEGSNHLYMSKLTEEQKAAVRQWAEEGANLNFIQSELKNQFDLVFTYFDTRLLVMELGLNLVDKKKKEAEKAEEAPAAPPEVEEVAPESSEPPPVQSEEASPAGIGELRVEMDQVAIPGMIASGYVIFSDGQSSKWTIDDSGRLGLSGVGQGYQPPAEDIPKFQQELHRLLG